MMLVRVLRSFWVRWHLRNWQAYRRWYGGRWECHYIEICASAIWLEVRDDRKWPEYRQPCSRGTPTIEDWPVPAIT